ncbi:putative bifunctional diguanylate cyclase/phosphodiesterase [Azoarcus taiwanensis]|uniref:EAL domain-containing protein n=1 Tax=Azoarcus taiwanensis TaxID=666964 RepID=A0A972F8J8_9RHOO|nr:EAL domain-containing protein [Azoarcus taiwanensis]NMG03942.1 EAL domain-containing protein [Azoarcus taiwanensis]
MDYALRLLLIDDCDSDARLIARQLIRSGFQLAFSRVDTAEAVRTALSRGGWSAVLCDFSMPGLTPEEVLALVRGQDQELPVIIVSGTISNEQAVRLMNSGAQDYVLKDDLTRLAPALAREIGDARERTARRIAENDLRRNKDHLRLWGEVVRSVDEGIVVTDLDGNIVECNPAFERITGYPRDEVLGRNPRLLKSGRHDLAFYQALWHTLTTVGSWSGEVWNRRKDGVTYPERLTINAVNDTDGLPTHYVGVFSDLSKQKENEDRLDFLTYHDMLTGLPNRRLFSDRLGQALEQACVRKERVAVLSLDLDRFKRVNESLGQSAGDTLLQIVAQRISGCLKRPGNLARLGSDEFLVMLTEFEDADDIVVIAHRILDEISRPICIEDQEILVTASMGVAVFPEDGGDVAALIQATEAARMPIRAGYHNRVHFFTSGMDAQARRWLALESELRQAIARDELQLYYQPLICTRDGRIRSVEALLRWNSPVLGWVSPEEFVPVAEDSGLILALGDWVLDRACRQARAWLDTGVPPVRVAINVSALQIASGLLPERIREALARTGLAPGQLEVELTESAIMADTELCIAQVEAISRMGVSVSLDDFGTGYSSLAYLSRFAFSKLKIDRSFVNGLESDPKSRIIVDATVGLARALGLQVVAEGVETESQRETLVAGGCDALQGYLYSPPVSPAALVKLMHRFTHCEPYDPPRVIATAL